jgi:class 3 adenylate cyclase
MNGADVDTLIARHLGEASGRLRECPVNEIGRGEATRRNYFIFKIDLVGSTQAFRAEKPGTYVRVAHAYLSTVDSITQACGAEREQTEYHGDGVLALFPERGNTATEVLRAAILSHYAVNRLRKQEPGLSWLRPKVLLHYAPLVVAKIGPWSESHRAAIGTPIHDVSKKEKTISAQQIWASDQFARLLIAAERTAFLTRNTVSRTEVRQVPATPIPSGPTLSDFLGVTPLAPETLEQRLARLSYLYQFPATPLTPARTVPQTVTVQEPDGYLVKLPSVYNALRLPQAVLVG